MEFITPAAVPYILPLIQTELVEAGCQFTCWKFHICNWQRERILRCSISPLIAAITDVTQDPTEDNCFAIASKTCVICQDTVHKIQINLKPTQGFEARHRVRENNEVLFITVTDESHCDKNSIEFSSKDADFIWKSSSSTYYRFMNYCSCGIITCAHSSVSLTAVEWHLLSLVVGLQRASDNSAGDCSFSDMSEQLVPMHGIDIRCTFAPRLLDMKCL